MADRKPPRLCATERTTLLALLQFQRESLLRKVSGVDESAAREQFVPSGTSLLWLVTHLARAESLWVLRRFAGLDQGSLDDVVAPSDTLVGAVAKYRAGWAAIDAVVAAHELDDVAVDSDDPQPVNLRWILLHLLEETARHAGHADIIRELMDGDTGR